MQLLNAVAVSSKDHDVETTASTNTTQFYSESVVSIAGDFVMDHWNRCLHLKTKRALNTLLL